MLTPSLKFYRTASKNLIYIAFFGLLTILLAYIGTTETENELPWIIGLAVFFGFCFLFFFYVTLFDKRPLVEINEVGLKVIYHQPNFVKWEDLLEVFEKTAKSQYSSDTFLCLNLRNKDLLLSQNLYYKICTRINRKSGYGEINIWVSILKVQNSSLNTLLFSLIETKDKKERRKIINIYKTNTLRQF